MTRPAGDTEARGGPLPAMAMFSVLPVPARYRVPGRRTVLWLPFVGAVLACLALVPACAVWRGGTHGSPLLAATLVVTGLAVLTGGLHLDGLADVADGLGSARPPDEARAIMKRSDIGPFGVAAVACVLLLQVAALAAVLAAGSIGSGVIALLTAVVSGRVAVVNAAVAPAGPGSRLGALVAGTVGRRAQVLACGTLLVAAVGARAWVSGRAAPGGWAAFSVLLALASGQLLARHAARRLGGAGGDLYGAVNEIATTISLIALATGVAWAP